MSRFLRTPLNRRSHFLLVGNATNANRGCEAILRGTVAILKREFGADIRITNASWGTPQEIAVQASCETDPSVRHVSTQSRMNRWSAAAWKGRLARRILQTPPLPYPLWEQALQRSVVALSVGGDTYSLDYGRPDLFVGLDRRVRDYNVPLVLWGASVGPFEADPEYSPVVFDHLRSFAGITVRESISLEYLRQHGFGENVYQVVDPAFAMDVREPKENPIDENVLASAIGLNISPAMAKYVTGGDLDQWLARATDIVVALCRKTARPVVLVPHVHWPGLSNDDYAFTGLIAERARPLLPGGALAVVPKLSAAETKWVISRCAVFAGMRTHSTIAAISSCVPTLSFAYSVKARGLNQDIFGSDEFCMEPEDLGPAPVTERVCHLLDRASSVRIHLADRVPELIAGAFAAGPILRRILEPATEADFTASGSAPPGDGSS